jgi:amino acid transporter
MSGFAIFAQAFVNAVGIHVTIPPILLFAVSASICWYVAYKDIRISSLLTLTLEAVSITFIVLLAGVILFKHGFALDTSQLKLKGVDLHGISLAVVISVFSLVGFESATTLGGEAKNPLRNVPKAVIWSLVFAGLFFAFMSYVEVSGARLSHTHLTAMSAPLNTLAAIYGVSAFKIPISLGAMVSFFGLSLTCLNAGARIMFPMAQHVVLPSPLGHVHHKNRTPHKAITAYIAVMVAIPFVLEIFTGPNTIFDDAGVLAAFGFLTAYFMISVAAPVYLRKIGELKTKNVVVAVAACVCLLVPTIGSFVPVPPFPVDIFPYIFLTYMVVGGGWLFFQKRRQPAILSEIAADLERDEPKGLVTIGPIEELLEPEGTIGQRGPGVPSPAPASHPVPQVVPQTVVAMTEPTVSSPTRRW